MILDLVLCVIAAAAMVLSFPYAGIWGLSWVGLVPFLLALARARRARRALLYGFVFGFIFYGGVLYWIWIFSFAGWVLLAAFHGVCMMLFALATFFMTGRGGWRAVVGIAGAWCLVEGLRYAIGFTWADLAYAHAADLDVAQFAAVGGTFGLGLMIVLVNAFFAEFGAIYLGMREGKSRVAWAYCAVGVVLVLGMSLWGTMHLRAPLHTKGAEAGIAVCQGDVRENDVEREGGDIHQAVMPIYTRLTLDAGAKGADFIIWPETVTPSDPLADDYMFEELAQLSRETQAHLFVGALHESMGKVYNSALLFTRMGDLRAEYRKVRLVLFGEYNPWPFLDPIISRYRPHGFYYSPGRRQLVMTTLHVAVGPIICFESTFPQMSRYLVRKGAEVLFVITNDEWYDMTAAADQHFQFSVFRAVENGVWVARGATTGTSALIDPRGRVTDRVPLDQIGMIERRVRVGAEGTPYSRYGDWAFVLAMVFYILAVPGARKSIAA
jgi:apolipoprotein N-acyltransferase